MVGREILGGKLPGQACVVGLFPIVSGVSCSPQSAAGSDFDFVTKHPRSVPRFPASRENRRRFRSGSQTCPEVLKKIIPPNPPRVSIDLGGPRVNRIACRSPGEFSSEFVAQLGCGVRESLLFAAIFDFPNCRLVACPSANMLPSLDIRLARSSPFEP